jgi:AraC-like DNA-binding protein
MNQEPSSSVVHVRTLLRALEDTGVDTAELCRACGLDPSILEDASGQIPRSLLLQLWRQAERHLPDPHLGLHLGERVQPRAANVVTYLTMSSRTLREGLERLIRYQRILGEGSRLQLTDEGDRTFIRIEFGSRELPATRDEIEYWAVVLLKYGRWIFGVDLALPEVCFSHPAPEDSSEHERIFGCRPRFGAAESGLWLASADLDRLSLHANPEIARAHEQFAQEYLAGLEDCSVTRQLRERLMAGLETGPVALETAARDLHIGVRTLQRRLRNEGTNYREVVDQLRRDVVLRQLRKTDASIEEITWLAGFSELSPFYRAFRRWTGKTPSQYRAAMSER